MGQLTPRQALILLRRNEDGPAGAPQGTPVHSYDDVLAVAEKAQQELADAGGVQDRRVAELDWLAG